MIQVIIQPGSIQVTGHAGAGPPGYDLVCAAVSTLVQTFVRSAEELTDVPLHSDIAPGGAFVRYEGSPQVQLLTDSFFVGVQGVAEAYPPVRTSLRSPGTARRSPDGGKTGGRPSEEWSKTLRR